jgi:hypothetical protein
MSVPADAVYTVKIVLTYAHHADDEIFVSFEGLTCTISGFGGKWLCKWWPSIEVDGNVLTFRKKSQRYNGDAIVVITLLAVPAHVQLHWARLQ